MFAVMVAGMVAFAAVFVTIVDMKFDEATRQYPTASLLVIAAGMSIPMTAWMLHRGMGRKNSTEMAAAMVLPVVPFLCLVWFGATDSAQCGPYCLAAILAMLALTFYRRRDYSMEMVGR
jgi:NhaP-type Na+/H+ or K+/H+ antiporter